MNLSESIRIAEQGLPYSEADYDTFCDLLKDRMNWSAEGHKQRVMYFGSRAVESMQRRWDSEHCGRCKAFMDPVERDKCDETWGPWICDNCNDLAKAREA